MKSKKIFVVVCLAILFSVITIPSVNCTSIKNTYQEQIEKALTKKLLQKNEWVIHPLSLFLAFMLSFVIMGVIGLKLSAPYLLFIAICMIVLKNIPQQ